ncbi:hypothetical protein D3C86_1668780 [compost metagenome]
MLGGHLFEDRGDHAAGAAPGGPEVDEHGLVGIEDFLLELGVGNGDGLAHG